LAKIKLNPGRGRLPELKNLVEKNPDEILRTLSRFRLEPDMAEVERAASRAFSRIDRLLDSGLEPDDETLDRIRGDVQREITGVLRKQAKTAIRDYRHARLDEMGFTKFAWIAVVLGSCPSCIKRHGKVKTMAQWEAMGLPGSPVLYCEDDCRCGLHPVVA
jgi:hypothetical protein